MKLLEPLQPPIYLIGYMAAGKTTVGRMLAERLGWHFVDLDDAFAEIHSLTPAEYIRKHGIEQVAASKAQANSARGKTFATVWTVLIR